MAEEPVVVDLSGELALGAGVVAGFSEDAGEADGAFLPEELSLGMDLFWDGGGAVAGDDSFPRVRRGGSSLLTVLPTLSIPTGLSSALRKLVAA